jgi:hypothetical protein
MPILALLLRAQGIMIMRIRHGPVPAGRRMFEVPAQETIKLARMHDLHLLLNRRTESGNERNRIAGVTWTNLAFVKTIEPS